MKIPLPIQFEARVARRRRASHFFFNATVPQPL